MESFGEDSTVIFNKFSKISYTTEIKKRMKDLASLDAIVDSINSPFEWKQDILKCMTWYEALKRIWRKLQIRGLIDVNYPLPLDATASENVDVKRFTKLATEAHRKSDQKVLNSQKRALFIELYRMVPIEDLKKLSAAFERDFYIFDYNSMPHELFNRS
ncbi:hypothetical protein DPMN_135007 [Dreissena polymorpha]|uniref:Uncharacterized protein n=1 Tax=Dreissena polymorpha TaxID=45954 RepID=A0A9D4G104_DREPO|nr:hypothetical protein DPMN_135007 [Dreissena polymorpha]